MPRDKMIASESVDHNSHNQMGQNFHTKTLPYRLRVRQTASGTKVGQLDVSGPIDQNVLWFDVPIRSRRLSQVTEWFASRLSYYLVDLYINTNGLTITDSRRTCAQSPCHAAHALPAPSRPGRNVPSARQIRRRTLSKTDECKKSTYSPHTACQNNCSFYSDNLAWFTR